MTHYQRFPSCQTARDNNTKNKHLSSLSGFTLIELMVVIAIIAILATIAIPSYRQYLVRNAESQAQAKMRQLQTELDAWRASSLTYKGFAPKRVASDGRVTYTYDNTANTQILIPNANNVRYTITLLDGTGTDSLMTQTNNLTVDQTRFQPNAWRILATPSADLQRSGASSFVLTSNGLACRSTTPLDITITQCPTGATTW